MSAATAAALFAMDPAGFGGLLVRGCAGPAREAYVAQVRALMAGDAPVRRLPISISDDRLLGGLDLALTLAAGRIVALRGVLAETDGGLLIAPMAERLSPSLTSKIVAVMDAGEVVAEREGLSLSAPARFGLLALDEGMDDEHVGAALADRLAFHVNCDAPRDEDECADPQAIAAARRLFAGVDAPDAIIGDLVETAMAFGIDSIRAAQHAVRAARAAAALAGRTQVTAADAALAAQLVLAPRARRLPSVQQEPEKPQPEQDTQPQDCERQDCEAPQQPRDEAASDDASAPAPDAPGETTKEAVRAALPADLLAQLLGGEEPRQRSGATGKSGAVRQSRQRGRPMGSRPGDPRSGARLALLDTLRAAAPLQRLRRKTAREGFAPRIHVRREDFRIVRFRERKRVTTIFVVDASGSSALHRLAEAKGAVQHLLAECYVRRDQAALIAFRGKDAEVLLPPTRSLARVRRSLSRLPGGGGTPLAAGVALALELAQAAARSGDTPVLVFLTDGQANVARDGAGDRTRAEADAFAQAKLLRASGFATLVIDTSPRPQVRARRLADELGGRYMPLPAADPAKLSRAIQAETPR